MGPTIEFGTSIVEEVCHGQDNDTHRVNKCKRDDDVIITHKIYFTYVSDLNKLPLRGLFGKLTNNVP